MSSFKAVWSALWRHPGHLIWILLTYLLFLGRMSVPLTGDQKVYLNTALEMRQYGSWLQPMLFGEPSYFKPPLQYWATLVGWKVFGFNLWGALIPSVLALLLTSWLLGEISELLHDKRNLKTAGLWFAVSLAAVTFGTTAQMEIYLCLFYAAAWWAAFKFLNAPMFQRRWAWLYVAFVLAGLSALIKSPLYSVFWVVGFFSYLLISGEWELFRRKQLYLAWALGALVGAAWFIAILIVDGQRFIAHYFLQETWNKYSGNSSTALTMWVAFLYYCFPFTLLIFPAALALWKRRRAAPTLRFLLAWSWAPAVFFTLYPYRTRPYVFLFVPVVAILVDWGYFRAWRSRFLRANAVLTGILVFVVLGALAVLLQRAEIVPDRIAIGLMLAGLFSLLCCLKDWMRGFAYCGLFALLMFRAAATSMGETDIADLRSAVQLHPSASIAMYDEGRNIWHEYGLLSAAIGKPIARLTDLDQTADFLQNGGMVALSDEQASTSMRTIEAKLLGRGDLSDVEERPWVRWKGRTRFPFKELLMGGRAAVPDFKERMQREYVILKLVSKR